MLCLCFILISWFFLYMIVFVSIFYCVDCRGVCAANEIRSSNISLYKYNEYTRVMKMWRLQWRSGYSHCNCSSDIGCQSEKFQSTPPRIKHKKKNNRKVYEVLIGINPFIFSMVIIKNNTQNKNKWYSDSQRMI